MSPQPKNKQVIQISDCLDRLAAITLEPPTEDAQTFLHSAELRNSILSVAGLNPVNETTLVHTAVKNALGKLPSIE